MREKIVSNSSTELNTTPFNVQRNCRDLPTGNWQFGHRCTVSRSSGMRNGTKLQAQSPTRQQHAAARIGMFEHGS